MFDHLIIVFASMHHQMAEGSKQSWCGKPAFGVWTGLGMQSYIYFGLLGQLRKLIN